MVDGERETDSSPAKRSRTSESATEGMRDADGDGENAAALSAVALQPGPGDSDDSPSLVSSIEVELSARAQHSSRHTSLQRDFVPRHAAEDEEHLRKADKRRADLEAAMANRAVAPDHFEQPADGEWSEGWFEEHQGAAPEDALDGVAGAPVPHPTPDAPESEHDAEGAKGEAGDSEGALLAPVPAPAYSADQERRGSDASERRARWLLATVQGRASSALDSRPQDGVGAGCTRLGGLEDGTGIAEKANPASTQVGDVVGCGDEGSALAATNIEIANETTRLDFDEAACVLRAAEAQRRVVLEDEAMRRADVQRWQSRCLVRAQEEEARRRADEEERAVEEAARQAEEEELRDGAALASAALRALQLDRYRNSLTAAWQQLEAILHRRGLCRRMLPQGQHLVAESSVSCSRCQTTLASPASASALPSLRLQDHIVSLLEGREIDATPAGGDAGEGMSNYEKVREARIKSNQDVLMTLKPADAQEEKQPPSRPVPGPARVMGVGKAGPSVSSALAQDARTLRTITELLEVRSTQMRSRKIGRAEMARGRLALDAHQYDEAYAFLNTALAAFRSSYSLEASAQEIERRCQGRGGEAVAGAGMRGLKETALQGEAEGAPADEDPVSQRGADNAFDGIVLSGARRAGEVASEDVGMLSCQEEMLELAEVLERVKQAEAESLLQAAQGKVQRVENMVAYLRNALILGGRGCLLLQDTV